MKKTNNIKIHIILGTCLTAIMAVIMTGSFSAKASVSSVNPEGRQYFFEKGDEYGISSSTEQAGRIQAGTGFGSFSATGDICPAGNVNGFPAWSL